MFEGIQDIRSKSHVCVYTAYGSRNNDKKYHEYGYAHVADNDRDSTNICLQAILLQ